MTDDDRRGPYTAREGYWFVPKRFGYGATPVTWQGWAVILGFAVAVFAAVRLVPMTLEKVLAIVVLVALLVVVCKVKTDGEWRWRNGGGR